MSVGIAGNDSSYHKNKVLEMKMYLRSCVITAMALLASGYFGREVVEMIFASALEQATPQESTVTEESQTPRQQATPEQQAAAERLGIPVMETNSIGMNLVLIPAGVFSMGSRESAEETAKVFGVKSALNFNNEHPQHQVRLTESFYMSSCEVTQEQYQRLMPLHRLRLPRKEGGDILEAWEETPDVGPVRVFVHSQSQHPVETTWDKAVKFCVKLTEQAEEVQAGRTYRLPTEAEWEYACRAGSTTRYSFGDGPAQLSDHAWFDENSSKATHPVGEKLPNAWGLHDMHGNVWEWCADWYFSTYYERSPTDNPTGPPNGPFHVCRGGAYHLGAEFCRSARRCPGFPPTRVKRMGFRVVTVPTAAHASPTGGGTSDRR